MKKIYSKPTTEAIFAIEKTGILAAMSNTIEGVTGENGRDGSLKDGGEGQGGSDMGANNGFFSYEDDSHYDAWSNW